jgi:aldehyde dehydrogenase
VPVFTAHPAAAKIAARALAAMNAAIEKAVGVTNALVTVFPPSIEATQKLFHHPGVALICVTGGPAVVKAAMQAGKRVVAAGPGNPPVVVDPCADLAATARHVIEGASFDNNLLCIAEKEVFVAEEVADDLMAALRRAGAVALDARQIDALTKAAFTFDGDGAGCARAHVKRDFVGKDASVLAEAAGVRVSPETVLLFGETGEDHAYVQEEQMMPFLPVVRVKGFERAVDAARKAEHGYRHTAIIHSCHIGHVTEMARVMNTTLFVHNGPCTAALGAGGAGYLSYSIATPTGEGVTTPMTFTRQRQLALAGALRFI